MKALFLLLLAVAVLAVPGGALAVNFETVETGTPSGAKCRLVIPAEWNGRLLIIAHGYIPAGRPLYAGFDPGDPVYRSLLDAGWIVAATSYRRNGFLFREAAADVEELRALVAKSQGREPESVLVEGTSMGGFVVALLAENPPHPSYRGALGLGAALNIHEPGVEVPALSGKPRFPVLFLANQDEAAGPTDYAKRAAGANVAVWSVARDGHVNLNRAEVAAAFLALQRWADGGSPVTSGDGTHVPPEPPQTVRFTPDGRAATGQVLAVDPAYGNLTVDFRAADLAQLGLKKGDTAELRFGEAGPPLRILLGTTFGDVKEGEWVCFPTADGFTLVSRNFADAAGSSGAAVGSAVTLRRAAP